MHVKKLERIFLILMFVALSASVFAQRPPTPALLLNPQRNYTSNITATDRGWFYKYTDGSSNPGGSGTYPSIEFSDDGNSSNDIFKAVYVRGSSVTVSVRLRDYLNSPDPIVGTLTLSDAKFVVGSTEHSISVSGPSTVSVAGSGGYQDITLTFTGLPSFVAKGQLKFKGYVTLTQACNGNPIGYIAWGSTSSSMTWQDDIYLTDQTPTGHQSVPWTDLLDYSCGWAEGQTGNVDVSTELTFGLYWSSLFAYNLGTEFIPSMYVEDESGKFLLKQMINDWIAPNASDANCVDVSFAIQLLCQSLGISASCRQLYEQYDDPYMTNPFCPIGSDAADTANYWQFVFTLHQQVRVGGNVYDGALALQYNLSGATYKNPEADWGESGYWQTFGVSGFPVLGLVYRTLVPGDDDYAVYGGSGYMGMAWTPDPNYGPVATNYYGTNVAHNGVK